MKRVFATFQWREEEGLFDDFADVKKIIQNEKRNSQRKISYTKLLAEIFDEMTFEEFNEIQKVNLPNQEVQMDFDKLVELIMEALIL
ncbi:MAG: hypothetical protein ACTSP3_02005 [Candidatus Heimdallarchaeaceae archaeon]